MCCIKPPSFDSIYLCTVVIYAIPVYRKRSHIHRKETERIHSVIVLCSHIRLYLYTASVRLSCRYWYDPYIQYFILKYNLFYSELYILRKQTVHFLLLFYFILFLLLSRSSFVVCELNVLTVYTVQCAVVASDIGNEMEWNRKQASPYLLPYRIHLCLLLSFFSSASLFLFKFLFFRFHCSVIQISVAHSGWCSGVLLLLGII